MKPSTVIDIINLAIFIGKLIAEYGPPAYKLGVQIYEAVEEWAASKGKETGAKVPSTEKAAEFDDRAKKAFIASAAIKRPLESVPKFRQDIWKSRKENFKKVKAFGVGVGVPKQ